MAIKDSFNLSQATTSQSYAYKCWYNYNYGNNTMKISAKDMGEITQTWNSELKNWRANAENDDNKYEIEDDDYSTAKLNGKESAKDKTGYDGGSGLGRSIGNTAFSAVGATAAAASQGLIRGTVGKLATKGGNFIKGVGGKAGTKGFNETLGKGNTKASQGSKKQGASAYLAAALAITTAAQYWIKQPNKDAKDACKELQNTMDDSQASLQMAQEDMTSAGDEIVDLSDQAIAYNEDANDDIEDKKTEYDMYKASYDALMEKVKSGETLSEDEKALLQELVPIMQQLGLGISETSQETTDLVGEIYDEMGNYQDTYDNAAETMGEVEGVTDYAESFDEATRSSCYVESAGQGLNSYSGISAGTRLCAGGWWNWALGIASIAAGTSSGYAATQQIGWAGDVGNEIDKRKATQDLNATSLEMYDENIDVYQGQLEGVEDLEMEIPEDMEDPEGLAEQLGEESGAVLSAPSAPTDGTGGQSVNSGAGATTFGGMTNGAGTAGGSTTANAGADDDKKKKV